MYLYFQPKLAYQGKTAQEWEKIYGDFLDVKCTQNDIKLMQDNINSLKPKKRGLP